MDASDQERGHAAADERPMVREKLETPEMRARIEKALERAAAGGSGPGSSAEDLKRLAGEQRSVDPRT